MGLPKPTHDNVLIRVLDAPDKTPGGILIPDTAKGKSQRGEVLAVGPGKWEPTDGVRCPMVCSVGTTVLFEAYGGVEFDHEGEKLLIMSDSRILAILK